MVSETNQKEIEAAGPVVHPRNQDPPGPLRRRPVAARAPWRGHARRVCLHPTWPVGPDGGRRDHQIYYQYKVGRARRILRGIGERVAKAEQAVAGKTLVKTEPVHPAARRHSHCEPRTGGQGPGGGRDQGLRHQPSGLPRPSPGHARVRDRCLSPVLQDREILQDGQKRPAGPGRSTIANATPSKPTSPSCSPPWPSAAGSRTGPAGQCESSSVPHAVTGPSRSRPVPVLSQPPTPSPATSARISKQSTDLADLRTSVAELGSQSDRFHPGGSSSI